MYSWSVLFLCIIGWQEVYSDLGFWFCLWRLVLIQNLYFIFYFISSCSDGKECQYKTLVSYAVTVNMPDLALLLDAAVLFLQQDTLAATWVRLSLAAKQTAASSRLRLPASVYRLHTKPREVLILQRLCVFWLSTLWRQTVLEVDLGSIAAITW